MSAPAASGRPAWATIDLDAIRANVATIRGHVAPAEVCVVVKANGYGHGAVPVARAAVEAGAAWLGVALVDEGAALREAGVDAPILVLSEPPAALMASAYRLRLTPTLYTSGGVEAAAAAATAGRWPVQVKIDTGMRRVGAHLDDAVDVCASVMAAGRLDLDAVWTHLAVADEPDRTDRFTDRQLDRFVQMLDRLKRAGIEPRIVHAANSAGALVHPAARFDLVRCGIAAYGIAPAPGVTGGLDLRPALSLSAEVTFVKRVAGGDGISYGLHYAPAVDTVVATVPLGYADGVPRRLSFTGGRVLLGGRARPIAGAVTMDQLLVDCGPGAEVATGDAAVLIGRQAGEQITAEEWAERLDTIAYEIVCGIGPRVPRVYTG